jgi:hypothetical protein
MRYPRKSIVPLKRIPSGIVTPLGSVCDEPANEAETPFGKPEF